MTGYEEDGADAHCVHCGCQIYFEVGPGTSSCPSCGKNFMKTDRELERELLENVNWEPENVLKREIEHGIDFLEMWIDPEMMNPSFVKKARGVLESLREIRKSL
jgi:uncharacterized Zn finger protein (UPF0148 family)